VEPKLECDQYAASTNTNTIIAAITTISQLITVIIPKPALTITLTITITLIITIIIISTSTSKSIHCLVIR
jgi:flagellar biosynthesis component FlhA